MWHKPCRTFHPWCPCIKTRCLFPMPCHPGVITLFGGLTLFGWWLLQGWIGSDSYQAVIVLLALLTHWPLGAFYGILYISNFQADFSDWWLRHLLRNCTQMNVTGPYDKSTLVQVMTWCCQAASHCLSQCWANVFFWEGGWVWWGWWWWWWVVVGAQSHC